MLKFLWPSSVIRCPVFQCPCIHLNPFYLENSLFCPAAGRCCWYSWLYQTSAPLQSIQPNCMRLIQVPLKFKGRQSCPLAVGPSHLNVGQRTWPVWDPSTRHIHFNPLLFLCHLLMLCPTLHAVLLILCGNAAFFLSWMCDTNRKLR